MKYGTTALGIAIFPLGGPEMKVASEGIVVAEATIKAALKGSEMKTAQESVSLPMIKDYVKN